MGTMILHKPSQKILNKMKELENREVTKSEMIGINIYLLREMKQLTQKKLSAESGLSISSISKIERGKRVSNKTVHQICSYLGYSIKELQHKVILNSEETGMDINIHIKKERKMLDLDLELLSLLGVK
ncbi:helix-turn-helix domain-containing protein [Chengkuizengella sediminis]|uniref:helix-turn-helix domain-containing protein n=1 Tax=Chengkuizengella sediminis TaxID=1885917 RepID=UPI00138A4BCC|nr:helix-turn-helix transcriptional regulator [Chengkuizengella sediminis]NDI36211.1 helix-turn-helix transcriptional regulator [Chengkuizengella sediminis]